VGSWQRLNYGIPLVITVHSLEPLRPWNASNSAAVTILPSGWKKTALEMADAVIAVSKETKADLERLFVIEPSRLHVIYNGIDLDEYRPTDSTEALRRYGIDPAKPFLRSLGESRARRGSFILCARSSSWIRVFRSSCAPALRILRRSPRK